MFWDRREVEWPPGSGKKAEFRLLGRLGDNHPKLAVCDFRRQRGIYVLYDDHGPTYVGLARSQDIGNRLRSHDRDHLRDRWSRFSWFGFRRILVGCNADGTRQLGMIPKRLLTKSASTIGDIETLLIETLGTYRTANIQQMRFASAERWSQIPRVDRDHYLHKIAR